MLYIHKRHFQMEHEKKSHKEHLCLNVTLAIKKILHGFLIFS